MRRNAIWIAALASVAAATAGVAQERVLALRGDQEVAASPQLPPAANDPQDPADTLYRAARRSLSGNDYARAATLFHAITTRYPRSSYAPDALYWEAFSLYRSGGSANFQAALARLQDQKARFPRAATRGDADALATRIRGELARLGDAGAAEAVTRAAARAAAPPRPAPAPRAAPAPRPAPTPAPRATPRPSASAQACPATDDDDIRTAALNALLQMNAEQAMPILQQVLARRDPCSAPLREKAVFLLSQKRTSETENTLLSVARNDPSPDVREKAVFWLSQVPTERAVDLLEQVVRGTGDAGVREKAVFALSQHSSPRASQALRSVAEQSSYPADLREKAIFWLGQKPSAENAAYLRSLYGKLDNQELKEKALFALSQMHGQGNEAWLLNVAQNERESMDLRKKALFWAAQGGLSAADLGSLYDRTTGQEMREQIVFALSQSRDAAAMDKLISIARTERDPDLRKKAIFWLSQSKDPRVGEVLMGIVNK
jgi:HEAT repeat protein